MGLPADPIGQELLKLIARDQYDRWLGGEVEKLLLAHFEEIAANILKSGLSPSATRRQAALLKQTVTILRKAYDESEALVLQELVGYAGVESQSALATLKSALELAGATEVELGGLTTSQLKAITELPIQGLSIGDWWEKQVTNMTFATRQQLQLGMINGEGVEEIARRISGVNIEGSTVAKQAIRNARMLAQTANTAVQNQAAFESYAQSGASDKYRYTAVKDNRTTPICRALDGQEWAYDDPDRKLPPQHINCRSTIVPVVDFAGLGLKGPSLEKLGWKSYSSWLSEQSKSDQDSILGPARAGLWRDGKASLEDMVDSDNRVINLKTLRERIGSVD